MYHHVSLQYALIIASYFFDSMDSRKDQQPSTPPPPYYSIVNANRQTHRLDQYPNQTHSEALGQRSPAFDQFIGRYESNFC